MELKKINLLKDRYCLIPLTGVPWRSQIYRDRKQMVGAGVGEGMETQSFTGTECQFGKVRKFSRGMVGTVAQ